MAGELILSEVSVPTTPASGKDSLYVSNDTPSRLKRVDSAGNVYIEQEFVAIVLTADYTLTDANTAQKAFNSPTNGQITVPASTSWEFDFRYLITNVGTTSHTWGVLFGGTATFTSNAMEVSGRSGTTSAATLTADSSAYTTDITTVLVATAASVSATEQVILRGRGIARFNVAGTFIPQVKLSAATTGASKMLKNSFFRMTPLGSDTVASVGNWS